MHHHGHRAGVCGIVFDDTAARDLQYLTHHLASRYGLHVSRSELVRKALHFYAVDISERAGERQAATA